MARGVSVDVRLDLEALARVARESEGLSIPLGIRTQAIVRAANAIGSGFRTKRLNHQSPPVGGTQAAYVGDVTRGRSGWVGIVHPANYAGMVDNHKNNTLLKARG
jgi:hypothetical protein